MADFAAMRALEVWYERIDVDRFITGAAEIEEIVEDELRGTVGARVEKARMRSASAYLVPKLVQGIGHPWRAKQGE